MDIVSYSSSEQTSSIAQPQRLLRPGGAIALIVGIVIGAGIYKTPSMVAGISGDAGWTLALWAAGALISMAGALCYAELCAAHPHAGGDYYFLRLAFGRDVSFLYAWSRASVINTGSIALLAFVFGDYASTLLHLGPHSSAIWALAVVAGLTALNSLGIQASSRLQSLLVVFEVAGLVAVTIAGFSVHPPVGETLRWFHSTPAPAQWSLCLVFILLTFGGWNEAAYISAELRGGPRAMVWVIVASLSALAVMYLLVNFALLQGLGLQELGQSKTPAADLLGQAFGPWAQSALSLSVAIAALTSINATMVVGARSNFALGLDWHTLRGLGQWRVRIGAPLPALWLQAAVSVALIALATQEVDGFSAMVEFTAPVFWGYLCVVGLALMRLRAREGVAGGHFRVPLYPVLPLVFCATCAWLTWSSIHYAISQQAIHVSVALLLAGTLAWLLLRWLERGSAP